MRTHPIFALAALLALTAGAFVPLAAASDPTSCNVHATTTRAQCTFTCYKGDAIQVSARATVAGYAWPRLHATCGGVDIICQNLGSCSAVSSDTVQYEDHAGVCLAETGDTDGTCSSVPTTVSPVYHTERTVATPPVGVGSGPQSVDTPPVDKACTPSEILCVGPIGSQHVATLPGVGPVEVLPAGSVGVGWDVASIGTPGVDTTTVGPVQVLGQPAPVTLCETPCSVPVGAHTGIVGEVTIEVFLGSTGVSRTIALP